MFYLKAKRPEFKDNNKQVNIQNMQVGAGVMVTPGVVTGGEWDQIVEHQRNAIEQSVPKQVLIPASKE
jgi:hypothetical protein